MAKYKNLVFFPSLLFLWFFFRDSRIEWILFYITLGAIYRPRIKTISKTKLVSCYIHINHILKPS